MKTKLSAFSRRILSILLLLSAVQLSHAQTIRGKVFDAETGEPMAGANVVLKDSKYATIVNLDGTYAFKNVKPGRYTVQVTAIGYQKSKEAAVNVTDNGIAQVPDFQLKTEARSLTEVVVTGGLDKRSDNAVRNIEKNSDIVQNILSEKTIQLLPDVTVANAL